MVVAIIIAVVALLVGGGAFYYVWKQQLAVQAELKEISNRVSEMIMDKKLDAAFSDKNSSKDFDKLAKIIFSRIKGKYGFKSDSFSEIVKEIKQQPGMDEGLRLLLADFFDKVVQMNYRGDDISAQEQEELQRKTKAIFKAISKG